MLELLYNPVMWNTAVSCAGGMPGQRCLGKLFHSSVHTKLSLFCARATSSATRAIAVGNMDWFAVSCTSQPFYVNCLILIWCIKAINCKSALFFLISRCGVGKNLVCYTNTGIIQITSVPWVKNARRSTWNAFSHRAWTGENAVPLNLCLPTSSVCLTLDTWTMTVLELL